MLVDAVKIRGDRPGADVGVGADIAVEHRTEMRDRRPCADVRVLDLGVGTDPDAVIQHAPGPQPAEWSHVDVLRQRRLIDMRPLDPAGVANNGIAHLRERPDDAILADRRFDGYNTK